MYLDPVEEYRDLLYWIDPLVGTSITPKKFTNKLKSWLTRSHPIRLRLNDGETSDLAFGNFTIAAEYDPDLDQANKKQIVMELILKRSKNAPFEVETEFAEEFVLELVEALVHEYQHQHQYRARRYKLHSNKYISVHKNVEKKYTQEYLGDPDEIDAYATNIAARIFLQNSFLKDKELDEDIWITKSDSLDLRSYYTAFGKEHQIVIELIKKIKENLRYLEGVKNGQIRKRRTYGKPTLRRRTLERGWSGSR